MGILSGFAQENNFSYTDDNGVTWGGYVGYDYDSQKTEASINTTSSNSEEEVVVPDEISYEGEKYKVTKLGSVFSGNKIIEKVTIPKTVTSLSSTFQDCSALIEVVNTSQLKTVSYAFYNCSSLKSVDLSSCETLGWSSFGGCSQLENVVLKACKRIEDNVFSNGNSTCQNLKSVGDISHCESIGEYAFSNCSSLTSVDLSSCKTIGNYSFSGCSALESIGSVKLLTNIPEYAFNGCSNLQNIDLSNCTSIGSSAFNGCSKIKHLNLNKCAYISSNAFSNCGLENIDLSATKTIEGYAFSGCSCLTKVTGLKLVKLLPAGIFYGCHKLSSIDLSTIESLGASCMSGTAIERVELPNLKSWDYGVFEDCKKLTSVTFPVTIDNIPTRAFWNCENLSTIDLSHCSIIGGGALYNCTSLTDIKLFNVKQTEWTTSYENYQSCKVGSFMNCNNLTSVDLGSIQKLGDRAFYGCTSLKKITLPSTITNLGWECFDGATIVTSMATVPPVIDKSEDETSSIPMGEFVLVNVPEASLDSYKSANYWKDMAKRIFPIGTKFDYDVTTEAQPSTSDLLDKVGLKNANSIVSLKVKGSINSYDVMVIRNKMDNLHYLDLSDANVVENSYEYYTGCSTKNDTIGRNAFRELSKLVTISLPNSVKAIESGALYKCTKLKSVVLPENLQSIEYGDWSSGAFADCYSLTDVKFKACNFIGSLAFSNCYALNHVTLPPDLKTIDQRAFANCSSLHSVDFPPLLESIGSYAFQSCALDSISLPGLTRIDEYAFSGCGNLKEVKVPSTLESVGDKAFEGCSNLNDVFTYTILPVKINQNTFCTYETATLHVPAQSYDNYFWDTEWSQFHAFEDFNEPYKYFYLYIVKSH